jgi:hypothetical protein
MGEVIAFRPKPAPVMTNELAEITAWLRPASDWWMGRMQTEMAFHYYKLVDHRRLLLMRQHSLDSFVYREAVALTREAEKLWRIECLKQVFIPATTVRHLRWKEDWLRRNGGGTPETALAIARDEAAFAGRIELHLRWRLLATTSLRSRLSPRRRCWRHSLKHAALVPALFQEMPALFRSWNSAN